MWQLGTDVEIGYAKILSQKCLSQKFFVTKVIVGHGKAVLEVPGKDNSVVPTLVASETTGRA